MLQGFKKPYSFNPTANSYAPLIYTKTSFPSNVIDLDDFNRDTQCITIELNVVKKKFFVFSICRTPAQKYKFLPR